MPRNYFRARDCHNAALPAAGRIHRSLGPARWSSSLRRATKSLAAVIRWRIDQSRPSFREKLLITCRCQSLQAAAETGSFLGHGAGLAGRPPRTTLVRPGTKPQRRLPPLWQPGQSATANRGQRCCSQFTSPALSPHLRLAHSRRHRRLSHWRHQRAGFHRLHELGAGGLRLSRYRSGLSSSAISRFDLPLQEQVEPCCSGVIELLHAASDRLHGGGLAAADGVPALKCLADGRRQAGGRHTIHEKIEGPVLHRPDGRFHVGVGGQRDDRPVPIARAGLFQPLELAVGIGEEDEHAASVGGEGPLLGTLGRIVKLGLVAEQFQPRGELPARRWSYRRSGKRPVQRPS